MSRPSIEKKASDLLEQSGVEGTYPVPLVPIAESLGYKLKEFEPDEATQKISGLVHYAKASILVNAQEPELRKRFTIAHELGHIVLHGEGQNYIDYRTISPIAEHAQNPGKETEANNFAAALLMPETKFREIFNLHKNYQAIAKYFDVSPDAARLRCINLKLS